MWSAWAWRSTVEPQRPSQLYWAISTPQKPVVPVVGVLAVVVGSAVVVGVVGGVGVVVVVDVVVVGVVVVAWHELPGHALLLPAEAPGVTKKAVAPPKQRIVRNEKMAAILDK